MCGNCLWPWSQATHLAAPPTRDVFVNLPDQYTWYPDSYAQAPAATQAYYATLPNSQSTYYWGGNATQQAGYYYNGQYYGATPPAPTGWPYTSFTSSSSFPYYYSPSSSFPSTYSYSYSLQYRYPYTYSPSSYVASYPNWPSAWAAPPAVNGPMAAAYFIARNTALAQTATAPMYFVGSTPAEIAAQNAQVAAMMGIGIPANNQLIPYKPSTNPQFWCKELDGSWTLREQNDFVTGDIGAGTWEHHPTSGYHYYVRTLA